MFNLVEEVINNMSPKADFCVLELYLRSLDISLSFIAVKKSHLMS